MFFKKRRYFKISRFNKLIYLFNIFLNFNKFYLEFFGLFGFSRFYFYNLISLKFSNNFLSIFSFKKNINFYNFISGLFNSFLFNIVYGLIFKYEKKLLIFGLGYKVLMKNNYLYFYLGFSHPIIYKIPFDIDVKILSFNEIILSGINKQRVNEISLFIKKFKKPDSYKGKGIRYYDENIVLKSIKKK